METKQVAKALTVGQTEVNGRRGKGRSQRWEEPNPRVSNLRDDNAIRIRKTGKAKIGEIQEEFSLGYVDLAVPGRQDVDIFRTTDVDFGAEESQCWGKLRSQQCVLSG